MRFAKAHGLGNDFILVAEDLAPAELSPWAVRLCDRHRGIGGDGVVLHSRTPDGVSFRLVNADGLAGEISGNGLRCLAALAVRNGWAKARHVVSTVVGKKGVEVSALSGSRYRVETDLGPPALGSADVPVALDPPRASVVDHPLEAAGRTVRVTATSMGNPHCALFLDEPADDALLRSLGPALEFHPFFPRRTNVEFIQIISRVEIRQRTWERGAGETLACGTGSSAVTAACVLNGLTEKKILNHLSGGDLEMEWADDGSIYMTGPAVEVFSGEIENQY